MQQTKNLSDYVGLYDNLIDKKFCEAILNSLKQASWSLHTYHDPVQNDCKSYDDDLSITMSDIPEREQTNQLVGTAIQKYFYEQIKFAASWYDSWNGYSHVRFNRYDPGTRMRQHCDHIQSLFDGQYRGIPTLTVLGTLNDDYDGGEFKLMGETVKMGAGSVIVFPSNFLYPHEVTPIKKGVRFSFVSWVW